MTMSAVENVKLALSVVGHVVMVVSGAGGQQEATGGQQACAHRTIERAEFGERIEWEVICTVKSFSHISFHLQVLVPCEKDPSFMVMQGGRGGMGSGNDLGSGAASHVYRPIACEPYALPAHDLLLRRPYATHEFHSLWNRLGPSWPVEVRFRPGLDFAAIVAALTSTRFVPVIQSINPQTLHMALCGCTWFGEQLFFTVAAAERGGAVEALIECRASSPVSLRAFARLLETDWLSSLFTSTPAALTSMSTSTSTSLLPSPQQRYQQQRPAVESVRRGERSAFSHFLSTLPTPPPCIVPLVDVSAPTGISSLPSYSNTLSASSSTHSLAPPTGPAASSLSSNGSGTFDLDSSSSSAIPYSVLLHSRSPMTSNKTTILSRWLDASKT